ncbi:MAG: cob(I)yrinic acid a,c-diamide adenosyltransferase [Candidatus Pacebacteria bacterium]|nr:cob(I)yrinic acid a,c-diamide adenosyltransferase [Candidatus Paceibacterota bacterium]MBP9772290.1 cob(I)yrinic acid a,c-diamide adenosyltransferase [Candidatus Paceibacterota bacterium]
MLYTGKGDNGTSKLFTTPSGERLSKTHSVFEALGTVDELNSFLGILKIKCKDFYIKENNILVGELIHEVQENLFVIQAELAGSKMSIGEDKLKKCEEIISNIENMMPPIKTFFISGGTEIAAFSDLARTITRRTERSILRAKENSIEVSPNTCAYINRLSSLFYAIARLANHQAGIEEIKPSYK